MDNPTIYYALSYDAAHATVLALLGAKYRVHMEGDGRGTYTLTTNAPDLDALILSPYSLPPANDPAWVQMSGNKLVGPGAPPDGKRC